MMAQRQRVLPRTFSQSDKAVGILNRTPGLPSYWLPFLSLVGALCLTVTTLTACAVSEAPGAGIPSQEVSHRVGVVHTLSGGGVAHSIPIGIGVHKAVGDVNRRWSSEGRHLELIVEDGGCTRRGGLNAARRLVEIADVDLIYAGGCSHETIGMAGYLDENGVILLTPLSRPGRGEFAFRNSVSKAAQVNSVIAVLESRDFQRFALLTNDTRFAQGFRREYIHRLPGIGGEIVADEVVPSGAELGPPSVSLTTYGALTGTMEEMNEFYRSLRRPSIVGPEGAGDVAAQAKSIATSAPDAVIVLPHTIPDAWFLLSMLRTAGFEGPGAMNHIVKSEKDALHFLELMEGFYVPTLKPQPDPDLTAIERRNFCDSDRHCAAAYSGVLLMAEALRSCGDSEALCLREFLTENGQWGSKRYGVLDASKEVDQARDIGVLVVQEGLFKPVNPK